MRHRDLLRDIDRRKLDKHNDRSLKLAVAIATPRDHRLFVREIPPAAESTRAASLPIHRNAAC